MRYPYLVIDDSDDKIQETLQKVERFPDCFCAGTTKDLDDAADMILEICPAIVFLGINEKSKNDRPFSIITDLYRYLNVLPHFVIISDTPKFAFEAVKAGAFDYLLTPLNTAELIRTILKIRKLKPAAHDTAKEPPEASPQNFTEHVNKPDISLQNNDQICIKSYGDYQFIALNDVMYLKADNNTTDFFLQNGRKLTAYKTLKYYENSLPAHFYRIHNSYIINRNYITRISTGKSLCYINGNDLSVSFSKTFKDNIDAIIRHISPD